MSKRSYLEVDDEARIDHLHAQLSDSTSIIVSPGKIQELAEMISGERNRLKSN